MLPHLLVSNPSIGSEERRELVAGVRMGPSRKAPTSGREVDARESGVVVGERQRAIGEAHLEIGAHPVEYGHEVVTQHPHAGRADAANALRVVVDQSIARWAPELDVFVHRNALDYGERKASLVDRIC